MQSTLDVFILHIGLTLLGSEEMTAQDNVKKSWKVPNSAQDKYKEEVKSTKFSKRKCTKRGEKDQDV